MEISFAEIAPYIWVSLASIIGLSAYKVYSNQRVKEQKVIYKKKKEADTIAGGIVELIDTSHEKINQIDKELAHLQKTGANEEQMSRLRKEREMLVTLDKYGKVIKPAAPIADRLLSKFVKTFDSAL